MTTKDYFCSRKELDDLRLAAYRAGMERAVEICKEQEDALSKDGYTLINLGAGNCAKAIRAELDKQK